MRKCPRCWNTEDDLFEQDEELWIDEPFCWRCNIRYSKFVDDKLHLVELKNSECHIIIK